MGVKFNQLPLMVTAASDDVIAVLDVSENILKRSPIMHAVDTNVYGLGDALKYGHVKVIDSLSSSSYVTGEALSAHQGAVLSDEVNTANTNVQKLQSGQINLAVNPVSTANMNLWIEV